MNWLIFSEEGGSEVDSYEAGSRGYLSQLKLMLILISSKPNPPPPNICILFHGV